MWTKCKMGKDFVGEMTVEVCIVEHDIIIYNLLSSILTIYSDKTAKVTYIDLQWIKRFRTPCVMYQSKP